MITVKDLRRQAVLLRNQVFGTKQINDSIHHLQQSFHRYVVSSGADQKTHYCNVCGKAALEFLPGPAGRPNAACPHCGSLERHRLLWLYLHLATNLFQLPRKKLLHFAPERCFRDRFKNEPAIDYTSVDLSSPVADVKADIQALPFADQSYDFILCSHVLEHIPDDRLAMRELKRVLTPAGTAVIIVPQRDADTTLEDPSITTPEDRKRVFGQSDHLRYYGRDFRQRLTETGFQYEEVDYAARLDTNMRELLGVRSELFYKCRI